MKERLILSLILLTSRVKPEGMLWRSCAAESNCVWRGPPAQGVLVGDNQLFGDRHDATRPTHLAISDRRVATHQGRGRSGDRRLPRVCERDRALPGVEFKLRLTNPAGARLGWPESNVPAALRIIAAASRRFRRPAGRTAQRGRGNSIDRSAAITQFRTQRGEGDDACRQLAPCDNKPRAWTYARPGLCRKRRTLFFEKNTQAAAAQAGFIRRVR